MKAVRNSNPGDQFDDKESHSSGSKPGSQGGGAAATVNDSQPKSRQGGGGADPADAEAGSSPEANVSGGDAAEGVDTGAKDAEGGGGGENAAEDRELDGGGDGGGGGAGGEGGGVGGGEDGAETMEPHGKAEEVRSALLIATEIHDSTRPGFRGWWRWSSVSSAAGRTNEGLLLPRQLSVRTRRWGEQLQNEGPVTDRP